MHDINLYQYPISPFTEKVRRVLTYKGLGWNPIDCHYEDKTNLLAVTGGKWTRVPVLEWSGEVVWNSADIIKWIDRKVPAPRVIPDDAAGDAKLKANREKLIGMTTSKMRESHAQSREALLSFAAMIDSNLRGKDFFLDGSFTMADASLYHPFFFLALNPANFALVQEFKHLMRWYERVRDLKQA